MVTMTRCARAPARRRCRRRRPRPAACRAGHEQLRAQQRARPPAAPRDHRPRSRPSRQRHLARGLVLAAHAGCRRRRARSGRAARSTRSRLASPGPRVAACAAPGEVAAVEQRLGQIQVALGELRPRLDRRPGSARWRRRSRPSLSSSLPRLNWARVVLRIGRRPRLRRRRARRAALPRCSAHERQVVLARAARRRAARPLPSAPSRPRRTASARGAPRRASRGTAARSTSSARPRRQHLERPWPARRAACRCRRAGSARGRCAGRAAACARSRRWPRRSCRRRGRPAPGCRSTAGARGRGRARAGRRRRPRRAVRPCV